MTAPNGDSLDGFVFPPFIPTASARPASPPPPAPAPVAEPGPRAQAADDTAASAAAPRTTMPWDLETPIVRDEPSPAPAADAAGADDEDDGEDLPWLEVPTPRSEAPAAPAPADDYAAPATDFASTNGFTPPTDGFTPPAEYTPAPAQPAAGETFPDWMAWDAQAEARAADELGNVPPVDGLEDTTADDGRHAPEPAASSADSADGFSLDALLQPSHQPPSAPAAEPIAPAAPSDAPRSDEEAFFDSLLEPADASPPPPMVDAGLDDLELVSDLAVEDDPEIYADAAAEPAPVDHQRQHEPVAAEPDPFTAAAVAESEAAAPAEADAAPPVDAVADYAPADEPEIVHEPVAYAPAAQRDEQPAATVEPASYSPAEPADAAAAPLDAVAEYAPAASSGEQPAAVAHALAGAFDDAAARLEQIARALRENPDEVLSGRGDPLALLVTGYVLGYTQGRNA